MEFFGEYIKKHDVQPGDIMKVSVFGLPLSTIYYRIDKLPKYYSDVELCNIDSYLTVVNWFFLKQQNIYWRLCGRRYRIHNCIL